MKRPGLRAAALGACWILAGGTAAMIASSATAQGVAGKAAASMSVGRTGPKQLRAPQSSFDARRGAPENSPWTAMPTSDDIQACLPNIDVPPAEKIVATCTVGAGGDLQRCKFSDTKDARMKVWAACVLPKFTAKSRYVGSEVEVPIQFTDQTASR